MRGVNKLILEIKNTDSEYFDRAILFLKPESLKCSQNELNKSADRLLHAVMEQRREKRHTVLLWVGLGMLLTGITAALLLLCA